MYHHRIVRFVYLFVPHLLKNLVCTEYPPGIRSQQVQDIKLDRRELDLLSIDDDLVIVFLFLSVAFHFYL